MPRIPDAELENLKRNTDLAALVRSRGVVLKKHGSRDLIGRCPLPGHQDDKPSFVVTPGKNLFHCFGCGAKGGPIDFVMKMDGLDFRGAVDALLARGPVRRAGNAGTPEGSEASTGAGAAPLLPEERAQVLLDRAVQIYAQNFAACPEGRAYLEKRGLSDLGLLQRHGAGYSNGRLPEMLPQAGTLRAELTALGLLLEDGRERFTGCVVFPVRDPDGRIVTLYGRYTGTAPGADGKRHAFLPNRPQGLWNAAALRVSAHVLLVESVLDGLSVETAGHANVVAIQGTNGLGADDVAALRTHGVQRVTLLLDGDPAGREASERLKEKELAGFAVAAIALPEGEDPNSFLVRHGAPALASLLAAKEEKPAAASVPGRGGNDATPERCASIAGPGSLTLAFGLRRYEVRGLEKTPRALKATVRVEKSGRLHVDTLDLNAARSRRQLALDLVRLLEESADTIEGDLVKLLTACEQATERRAGNDGTPEGSGASTGAGLSPAERSEGEAFGKRADLIDAILADYERCGLVGERGNKLLMYLAMTSRKMAKPLAVLNLASSGAGKTALQDGCLAFCPPEDLLKLTSLSGKALFYKERDSLRHKVLALEEGDGVAEAMYALRNLISAGELVTESTIKDPATGRLITMANKVEGPTAVFLTTTNPETDPETKSRFFVTSVDESREQTEAILSYQRRRYTLDGFREQAESAAVVRRHHAFQRVLAPLAVVNPFAEQLRYGDSRLPSRRDQPKYLGLIGAIAFLRQLHKPVKTYAGSRYIEVDRADIALANELATDLLGHSLGELSRPGYELLLVLDKLRSRVSDPAPADAGASDESATPTRHDGSGNLPRAASLPPRLSSVFTFTRRQVREFSGWAHHRVHRYMAELIELEYVAAEGRAGCMQRHQLLWEGQGKDGGRFLLGLCPAAELRSPSAA